MGFWYKVGVWYKVWRLRNLQEPKTALYRLHDGSYMAKVYNPREGVWRSLSGYTIFEPVRGFIWRFTPTMDSMVQGVKWRRLLTTFWPPGMRLFWKE